MVVVVLPHKTFWETFVRLNTQASLTYLTYNGTEQETLKERCQKRLSKDLKIFSA